MSVKHKKDNYMQKLKKIGRFMFMLSNVKISYVVSNGCMLNMRNNEMLILQFNKIMYIIHIVIDNYIIV